MADALWFSIQIHTTWSYRAGGGPALPHGLAADGAAGAGAGTGAEEAAAVVAVVGDGSAVLEAAATVVDGGDDGDAGV